MAMEWTDQLSIDNKVLDSEHKELFELARCIECASKANDRSALARDFKLLKDCMDRHFSNEELLAHALNIPFTDHQIDHRNILAAVDLMRREIGGIDEENAFITERYNKFLQDWVLRHLNEHDMLMKPMLQTCPYKFKIESMFVDN